METIERNPRRNFLLAASLGGVGAVVAAAIAHTGAKLAPTTATVKVEESGYRATPHILTYYKTTEF